MKSSPGLMLHQFPDADALFEAAAAAIGRLARQAVTSRQAFHMALAGGTTPLPLYRKLNKLHANWEAWHVYFGDERCLPPDDPERNSAQVEAAWLHLSPIPAPQIHAIPAELGGEEAARQYAKAVDGVKFDLVLLGLGEDGHTASLFPGRDWGTERNAAPTLAVHDAPKPPPDRVSLSARRLSDARRVFFLVSGESKREAVQRLMEGDAIPAAAIRPPSGIDIYTDIQL